MTEARPAFYALRSGGWRDYVTLLHPPYTIWHLSYVAIGAALAPRLDWAILGWTTLAFALAMGVGAHALDWAILGWTTLAFALAMGVGAHALDELHDRPLRTRIPSPVLVALAAISIAAACAIGIAVAAGQTWWLLVFIGVGAFIVVAYNLELAGGRFHSDVWFAIAWGAFPLLTAYFALRHRLAWEALLGAAFAFSTALAQRTLSTPVRHARRSLGDSTATQPLESALQMLAVAMPLLAGALLTARAA